MSPHLCLICLSFVLILGLSSVLPAVNADNVALSTGSGLKLEVEFDQSLPSEWIGYVRDFYYMIYPEMETFCGPPIKSGTVLIRFDATRPFSPSYDIGRNTIVIGRVPKPPQTQQRDFWWDLDFISQVSRAFCSPCNYLFANWAHGVHRAIASLILMSLTQKGKISVESPNWIYFVKTYDVFSYLGGDTVAGTTWGNKTSGSPFWNLGGGMFLILAFSFPSKQTGQFDYLARVFKAIQYNVYWSKRIDLSRESYFYVDRSLLEAALNEAADGQRIDGSSPSEWVKQQAVTFEKGTPGPHLGVYIDDVDNPWQISVFAFDRKFNPRNPIEGFESPLKNTLVWIRVIDWKGDLIYSGNVTTGDDGRAWARPRWKLTEGGYSVFAEANYGKVRLSSRGYAINRGQLGSIQGLSSRLLGVVLDGEGESVSGSIRSSQGRMEFCRSGIFSIDIGDTLNAYETSLSSNSAEKRITKPAAFVRIVPMSALGVGDDLRSVVWGKILDADTKSPLPGVAVKVYRKEVQKGITATDPTGNFRLGVRGECNYTIFAMYFGALGKSSRNYIPSTYVFDTRTSRNSSVNFLLLKGALIILDKQLEFFDITKISSVNITLVDRNTERPMSVNGTLYTYGYAARFLGLDWRQIMVPPNIGVKLRLDVLGTLEEIVGGRRTTRSVSRSFVADEVFRMETGQEMTLDMRRLSMLYNLHVLNTLVMKANELIRQSEEYGFYVVSEKKELTNVNKLSSSAYEKNKQGKFSEGFSDAKVGYNKASYLLESLSMTFSESYWSGLMLVFFFAFCAAALAAFAFDRSAAKLLGLLGTYVCMWLCFYQLFPGCRIVPQQILVSSSIMAIAGSATLSIVVPATLGRAKGSTAHLSTLFSLAKRNLRRRKLRTTLLTITMAILVLSFVALTSFSVEHGLETKTIAGTAPSNGILVREDPAFDARFATLAPLPEEITQWLSGVAGVIKVVPKFESMPELRVTYWDGRYFYDYLGSLSNPATNTKMPLLGAVGIRPAQESAITHIHEVIAVGRLPEEDERGVMISVEAAQKYGFHEGEQLILSLATGGEMRSHPVTLVGLLDDARLRSAKDLDGQSLLPMIVRQHLSDGNIVLQAIDPCEPATIVLLNIATAQGFPGALSVSRLSVVSDSVKIPNLARQIALARDLWVWTSVDGKIQSIHLASYIETQGGFLVVPLALVGLNLGAAIYMAISERKRETMTLSTLGVDPGNITRMFLGEAILIALLGSGIGYLSGLGFYRIMSLFLLNPEVRQKVSASWSIAAIGLAMAVSILGAHIPSKRAAVFSTPIRLARWRMKETYSEAEGWRITLPLKIETEKVDQFMRFMFERLQRLDRASDHVERLKMLEDDSNDSLNRRLDFTFMLRGKGVVRAGYGAGSFFMLPTRLVVSGRRKEPLKAELICKESAEAKDVVYQVADMLRKTALDWSAIKEQNNPTHTRQARGPA